MKKIVLTIDSTGQLVDDSNACIYAGFDTAGYNYKEQEEVVKADVAQLVSLGVTADDLLKLKASGII